MSSTRGAPEHAGLSSGVAPTVRRRTMSEHPRRRDAAQPPRCGRPSIDEHLLARAVEINESVASEFAERCASPLDNLLLDRMAELGVETDAAASVALQRAHR